MFDFNQHLYVAHLKPNSFSRSLSVLFFCNHLLLFHMSVSMVSDCDQNSLNRGTKHLAYSSQNSTQRRTHPKQRAKIQPWHQSHVRAATYSAPKTTPKDPSVAPTTSLMKSENPKCDTSARHCLTKRWKPKKWRLVLKKPILNLKSKNFHPKPIRNAKKNILEKLIGHHKNLKLSYKSKNFRSRKNRSLKNGDSFSKDMEAPTKQDFLRKRIRHIPKPQNSLQKLCFNV